MKCDFEFVCNKEWYELAEIDTEAYSASANQFKARFCTTCQKKVHRVDTEEELKAAIADNFCIAVGRFDKEKIKWFRKVVESSRTIGLPRKLNNGK